MRIFTCILWSLLLCSCNFSFDQEQSLGVDTEKDNNYGEYCELDSDCFCNRDDTGFEGCYYKTGTTDICEKNICKRGSFRE